MQILPISLDHRFSNHSKYSNQTTVDFQGPILERQVASISISLSLARETTQQAARLPYSLPLLISRKGCRMALVFNQQLLIASLLGGLRDTHMRCCGFCVQLQLSRDGR